jgi:hypothetical protein
MELSLAGLIGAVVGALLGAFNYAMLIGMIERKLRADDAAAGGQAPQELERRISAARRTLLAFEMLVFVGAGYWIGTSFW